MHICSRLEGLTGEAQGDICDDMPPPPPGVTVPPVDVKPAQKISPELALSSIVRVVRIARPATKGGAHTGSRTISDDIEPGPVDPWHAVEMVRDLRSERNELRRRDRLGRDEISQLRSVLILVIIIKCVLGVVSEGIKDITGSDRLTGLQCALQYSYKNYKRIFYMF